MEAKSKRRAAIDPGELYTMAFVAEYFHLTLHTLYEYRKRGQFKATRYGAKNYLVTGEEILRIRREGFGEIPAECREAATKQRQRYRIAERKAKRRLAASKGKEGAE